MINSVHENVNVTIIIVIIIILLSLLFHHHYYCVSYLGIHWWCTIMK